MSPALSRKAPTCGVETTGRSSQMGWLVMIKMFSSYRKVIMSLIMEMVEFLAITWTDYFDGKITIGGVTD